MMHKIFLILYFLFTFFTVEVFTQNYSHVSGNWIRVDTSGPSYRLNSSLVYDIDGERVILFGGVTVTNLSLGDTWVWNGSTRYI